MTMKFNDLTSKLFTVAVVNVNRNKIVARKYLNISIDGVVQCTLM